MPHKTIAEFVLYGFRSSTYLSLPLENSFKHALLKQESSNTSLIYENVTGTGVETALSTSDLSYRMEGKVLKVEMPSENFASALEVFDMQGRKLMNLPLQSTTFSANLSQLFAGVYVIKLGRFSAKIAL